MLPHLFPGQQFLDQLERAVLLARHDGNNRIARPDVNSEIFDECPGHALAPPVSGLVRRLQSAFLKVLGGVHRERVARVEVLAEFALLHGPERILDRAREREAVIAFPALDPDLGAAVLADADSHFLDAHGITPIPIIRIILARISPRSTPAAKNARYARKLPPDPPVGSEGKDS
ncbi:MAG: hypothetical protein ACREVG_10050 [Burkholderiales bacterium]